MDFLILKEINPVTRGLIFTIGNMTAESSYAVWALRLYDRQLDQQCTYCIGIGGKGLPNVRTVLFPDTVERLPINLDHINNSYHVHSSKLRLENGEPYSGNSFLDLTGFILANGDFYRLGEDDHSLRFIEKPPQPNPPPS